jgi:hypothetical protein
LVRDDQVACRCLRAPLVGDLTGAASLAASDRRLRLLFSSRGGILCDVEGNRAEDHVKNLELALEHRTRIGIAIGMLMVRFDMDADAAFAYLRRTSQNENRRVNDPASDVMATGRRQRQPADGARFARASRPPDQLLGFCGNVFEVAWRGTAARTTADGGAGLGLGLGAGIFEAHH